MSDLSTLISNTLAGLRNASVRAELVGSAGLALSIRESITLVESLGKIAQQEQQKAACMAASRERWKAEARGRTAADRMAEARAEHEGEN